VIILFIKKRLKWGESTGRGRGGGPPGYSAGLRGHQFLVSSQKRHQSICTGRLGPSQGTLDQISALWRWIRSAPTDPSLYKKEHAVRQKGALNDSTHLSCSWLNRSQHSGLLHQPTSGLRQLLSLRPAGCCRMDLEPVATPGGAQRQCCPNPDVIHF
jgi:hypothetical protein